MNWNDLLSEERFVEHINEDCTPYRTDYDTIICSTLFRRLQDKAQVFPLDDDDYVRTRLTHSLEVSAIGKKLGECAFAKVKAAVSPRPLYIFPFALAAQASLFLKEK